MERKDAAVCVEGIVTWWRESKAVLLSVTPGIGGAKFKLSSETMALVMSKSWGRGHLRSRGHCARQVEALLLLPEQGKEKGMLHRLCSC